jgi:hypothetical protein
MKDLFFFPERAVVFQPAESGGAADGRSAEPNS